MASSGAAAGSTCPWPRQWCGSGLLNEARPFPGHEGAFFDDATQCDDYAISPWEFHWESQSLTREASATGQRYIHHVERGSRVLLPLLCLGFADDVNHEGERPMQFVGGCSGRFRGPSTLNWRWQCEHQDSTPHKEMPPERHRNLAG